MKIKYLIFDLSGLLFIFFIPELTKLLNFTFYLLEPMRIVIVLAVVHTSKTECFPSRFVAAGLFIAFSKPPFSYKIRLALG